MNLLKNKLHKTTFFLVFLTLFSMFIFFTYLQKTESHFSFNTNKPAQRLMTPLLTPDKAAQTIQTSNQLNCHSEWLILNSNVYFRSNLAFYFNDLNKIKLYLEHRSSFSLNVTLKVEVTFKNAANSQQYLINQIKYDKIAGHQQYVFATIEANLTITTSIQQADLIRQIHVEIQSQSCNSSVGLDLKIKRYHQIDSLKKYAVTCSKVYYVKNDLVNQFKWWIEMNRMHGYDKVVIYNNSIANSAEFERLFAENKNFVQLIQFKCLPNFIETNNAHRPFINYFKEIETLFKKQIIQYHVHFEEFVFTECYLENKDKYKYVTVNDQDETVVPRYLNDFRRIQTDFVENNAQFVNKSERTCFYGDKNVNSIEEYLKRTKKGFLQTKPDQNITFHFSTGIYMKDKTMNVFFNQLGKVLNINFSNQTNLTSPLALWVNVNESDEKNNRNGGQRMDFNVTIKNENELMYARYLHDLYFKIVKPFNQRNQLELKKIYEPFNRFFYLLGLSTTWFAG